MTTRGMGTAEFSAIADIIADRLLNPTDASMQESCKQRVLDLCDRFPLYPHLTIPVPALV